MQRLQYPPEVKEEVYTTSASDGHILDIHHFSKSSDENKSAIYYIHGGYVAGKVNHCTNSIARLCSLSGADVFAIEYRLAPEHPFPIPLEDCCADLEWPTSRTSKFLIDPSRIGVYGESAGGGLAAALCIAARDRGLQPIVKKQILIYPIIENRNMTPNPDIESMAIHTVEDNITGWTAYLGLEKGEDPVQAEVPAIAAAARLEDVKGLPATYIEVGTLDIFREENMKYAGRLMEAGIDVELHLYSGVPHVFETLAPGTRGADELWQTG